MKTNRNNNEIDSALLEAFARGAEIEREADDKRRIPAFVLRLTELELRALRKYAEETEESMHAFCIRVLRKEWKLNKGGTE